LVHLLVINDCNYNVLRASRVKSNIG
jgi:hypothetical protein